ncbi:DUF6029 family protein [Mangrovimonas xylaniphaga]|uniref:DUF6029 family protein n=1 Tax=Mangrovimonas xylaniphaga TaxID=1645915 RepID=UPI000AE3B4D0|nr:DUF6029 family protein [Mangrovimonas xylaniphaga]
MRFAAVALLWSAFAQAQDYGQLSGGLESNSQYYVDDKKTGDFTEDDRFRSNNYLRLDYTIKNWFANVQLESFEPRALLNYYPKYEGTDLGTFSVGYKSQKLEVTVGNFYEQFGSGLVLRTWEDRQLGINNSLRGGHVTYRPFDAVEVTALYGRQRDGFEVSRGDIYGFNTELGLGNFLGFETTGLDLGFSYVGRYEDLEVDNTEFNPMTNAFSTRLDFSEGSFYASGEYVLKGKDMYQELGDLYEDTYFDGNALLLNLGYAKSGLGIDATFRRMENMAFYSQRDQGQYGDNPYNQDVVNYLPALTKQHDYSLANIYVYQSQPKLVFNPLAKAGEIGGQIDVYKKFNRGTILGGKYGTKIALNYATWYGLDSKFNAVERTYDSGDFLAFGQKYFRETSMEVRKKISSKWSTIVTLVDTYYNTKYVEDRAGEVNAFITIAEATYKFGSSKSIRIEGQHMWSDDKDHDRAKNWAGGTLEYNFNSKFAVFATDIWNYGNPDEDRQIHYYNFGGSFTKGSTRIGASYGRQRGGLVCVGGICRYVPQNTGFTLNIATAF